MSPPQGHVEEGPVKVNGPDASVETTAENCPELTEHNYMGLSDSTVDSSVVNSGLYEKDNLNLKATELRLGLPGSESPARNLDFSLSSNTKLGEKNLFPMAPIKETSCEEKHSRSSACPALQKNIVSGNKRVFSDAMDGFSEGKFIGSSGLTTKSLGMKQNSGAWHGEHSGAPMLSSRPSSNLVGKSASVKEHSGTCAAMMKETISPKISQDRPRVPSEPNTNQIGAAKNPGIAPAAKAQVVGWPPIRSYRKNTLAATSKGNEEVDGKPGLGPMFVKVSMDGAPYLRKVDLKTCGTYSELSSSLEKMFSCFTIGQCGSQGVPGRDLLSESKLIDLIHGSEYVLTYEDKDGDWMLVGDVPWDMFVDSCRRLCIMKGSDAIGLAPRAMEKSRTRN